MTRGLGLKKSLKNSSYPLVSVIIVNFNGLKWLQGCFSSLMQQTFQNFEIIFIDNCSKDKSVSFVKENFPKTKIVQNNQNYGFAKGNNQGFKIARGDYLLLLNNDTLLERDYLEKFLQVFIEYPSCGIAQSKLLLLSDISLIDSAGSFWTSSTFLNHYGYLKKDASQYNNCYQIFSAKGASLLLKREIADTIGLFDDKFWCYYEDTDLCHRAWLSGYEVWYYPKAVCYHNLGSTSSLFSREEVLFHNFKNKYISFVKNFEFLNMVKYVLVYTLVLDGYLLLMILKRRFKVVWAIFRSQAYLIKTFSQIWKQRNKVQKYRKIKDNIFLKNLTREMSFWEYWRSI